MREAKTGQDGLFFGGCCWHVNLWTMRESQRAREGAWGGGAGLTTPCTNKHSPGSKPGMDMLAWPPPRVSRVRSLIGVMSPTTVARACVLVCSKTPSFSFLDKRPRPVWLVVAFGCKAQNQYHTTHTHHTTHTYNQTNSNAFYPACLLVQLTVASRITHAPRTPPHRRKCIYMTSDVDT
jgi:hypothetical protein